MMVPAAGRCAHLRFWTTTLGSDASMIGKTIRQRFDGDHRRRAGAGALPAETEIMANVDQSHHLDATGRRRAQMTELFGRLAWRR